MYPQYNINNKFQKTTFTSHSCEGWEIQGQGAS
jgi:hypothetical protein